MPQGSGTAATMRKYVYTCCPGLAYNECQFTLLMLLFYECTITATAKGCYPESGEINENFRKTVINSYLRVLHFF